VAINQNFQQLDFFTRAPRDVSKDVIDWSEITGKFVDFINIERDRRMAAKAEIDKNISTTLATMDNLDVGMDVEFNNWMFEGANNMRQYLLTQEKLLKSGQISVAQFKRNLSNTEGTVTNFKNYTTQYNQAVTKREQMRMGVDEEGNPIDGGSILSKGDEWLTQHTGRYMDFGGTELVIGKDGTGGVVFTTGDPTMPYETNSLQSMGNLINMSQQMFTAYDYFSDVTAFVDEIGAVTQGNIRLNETSEQFNAAYQPAKEDFISSIVDSPSKLQSMASDHLQEDIFDRYTTDESKMDDPNALVFINQGGNLVPAMDSKGWQEVRAKAVEFLSDAIDVQTTKTMEFKEKPRSPEKPKRDQLSLIYQSLDDFLATGNPASLNAVASATGLDISVDDSGDFIDMTVGAQGTSLTRDGGNREQLFASIATQVGAGQYHNEVYRGHADGSYATDNMSGMAKAPKGGGSSSNFESSSGGEVNAYMKTEDGKPVRLDVPAPNLGWGDKWEDAGDDPDKIRIINEAILNRAFIALAYQKGVDGTLKTSIEGSDYVVRDNKDNELAVIPVDATSSQIDALIQEQYQSKLITND